MTDQQLSDEIDRRRHVSQVTAGLLGIVAMPGLAIGGALGGALIGWVTGSRRTADDGTTVASSGGYLAASSHALLPLGMLALVAAIALLHGGPIAPDDPAPLVPATLGALHLAPQGMGLGARLIAQLGPFGLWAAALYGLGLAAASGMRRIPAAVLSLVLYTWITLVTRVHA
jgi:hypothetical protein